MTSFARLLSLIAPLMVTSLAHAHAGKMCANEYATMSDGQVNIQVTKWANATEDCDNNVVTFVNVPANRPTPPMVPAKRRAVITPGLVQCIPGEKPIVDKVDIKPWYWRATVEKIVIQKSDADTGNQDLDAALKAGLEVTFLCRDQAYQPCESDPMHSDP